MEYLICGLGNYGTAYVMTRHNVGFEIVDILCAGQSWKQDKDRHAEIINLVINDHKILWVKPTTFMNESGRAVRSCSDYYDIPGEHIVVIHDDLDLPFGTIRISQNRGDGGHNGIKSIYAHMGTKDIIRIRIGIAQNHDGIMIKPNVLGKFNQQEKEKMDEITEKVSRGITKIITEGVQSAMNVVNI